MVAVGHRVVHGGAVFGVAGRSSTTRSSRRSTPSPRLAPLHNPPNLTGIQVARELLPDVPHVVVFDTAFFRTLPEAAATYAIDQDVAREHGVRRYGFHGTSHQYVSGKVARVLGRRLEDLNQIVLHLGNGASASAVRGGVAVETSMGMTPLEGLVMGTRSGDIDPAVLIHLQRNAGLSVDDVDDLLNRRSGLKGLAGENDFRELHALVEAGDEDAVAGPRRLPAPAAQVHRRLLRRARPGRRHHVHGGRRRERRHRPRPRARGSGAAGHRGRPRPQRGPQEGADDHLAGLDQHAW